MKIIIDNKIPYSKGALEPYADVKYIAGADTTPEDVKTADAIITRTRTKCNESLLKDSSVKFIASATIGHDHIDKEFCSKNNIEWTNAPGCNSGSVMQYVASVLVSLSVKHKFNLKGKTLGVVGVGNVGSKIVKLGLSLGMKVLMNDPPRAQQEENDEFVSLDTIIKESDIISFHVPLIRNGEFATYHLANKELLKKIKQSAFIINSSRGEVVNNNDLKEVLEKNIIAGAVLDVWENEPEISLDLLNLVDFATPHIAGYSRDGKANGTTMSVRALSKFFKLGIDDWNPESVEMPANTEILADTDNKSVEQIVNAVILETYNIANDDKLLRESVDNFEEQRGEYPVRREFFVYSVSLKPYNSHAAGVLNALGFKIKK